MNGRWQIPNVKPDRSEVCDYKMTYHLQIFLAFAFQIMLADVKTAYTADITIKS